MHLLGVGEGLGILIGQTNEVRRFGEMFSSEHQRKRAAFIVRELEGGAITEGEFGAFGIHEQTASVPFLEVSLAERRDGRWPTGHSMPCI